MPAQKLTTSTRLHFILFFWRKKRNSPSLPPIYFKTFRYKYIQLAWLRFVLCWLCFQFGSPKETKVRNLSFALLHSSDLISSPSFFRIWISFVGFVSSKLCCLIFVLNMYVGYCANGNLLQFGSVKMLTDFCNFCLLIMWTFLMWNWLTRVRKTQIKCAFLHVAKGAS